MGGAVLGADAWGLRPVARAESPAVPDGLTLHVEMLRLAVMFRRSGHRQIEQALETGMAGEIRAKMATLRLARETMIAGMAKEIDGVIKEVLATHVDGIEAMKLPRAELAATRQEIREIRAEFAPTSNGGPAGPLSGTGETSPKPSAASVTSEKDSSADTVNPVAALKAETAAEAGAQTETPAEVAPATASIAALAEPMASFQGAHEPG